MARFSLLHKVQTDCEVHPAYYLMGIGEVAISQGVKRTGREDEHSPPSSEDIKNGEAISSLPHLSLGTTLPFLQVTVDVDKSIIVHSAHATGPCGREGIVTCMSDYRRGFDW
jgi:hypothetical protein